jgi:hypothetical protein
LQAAHKRRLQQPENQEVSMSTIVALNPPGRAVRDPAIAAIDKYLAALKIWQTAD